MRRYSSLMDKQLRDEIVVLLTLVILSIPTVLFAFSLGDSIQGGRQ